MNERPPNDRPLDFEGFIEGEEPVEEPEDETEQGVDAPEAPAS